MSEAYFELRAEFKDRAFRDKAIEYMMGKGPAFEDEVEASFHKLYLALEDIESPTDFNKIGNSGLVAYFEIFGGEAIFEAQDYMESWAEGGATKIYGYYCDDDEVEVYWTFQDNEIRTLYEAFSNDAIDSKLWNLEEEERLSKVIELYEAGKL
jgi:hypothetical protein